MADRIRKEPNAVVLMDRYKSLSDEEGGEMYRKFKAMRSIEALADYVGQSSWGSLIDLELLEDVYKKYKLRFIVIKDNNSTRKIPFVHVPNVSKDMDKETSVYGIFILNDERFELVMNDDEAVFKYEDIPFIEQWYQSQLEFEESLPY